MSLASDKKILLAPWQRIGLYALGLGLLVTGGVWVCFSQPSDSPWPSTLMKIHGAAAMLFLVLLGSLSGHVANAWKSGRNRASGVGTLGLAFFMAASGWGLYYIGHEGLRHALSLSHAWLGFGMAVLVPTHIILGRKTRKKGRS